jgi:hypothetical protein
MGGIALFFRAKPGELNRLEGELNGWGSTVENHFLCRANFILPGLKFVRLNNAIINRNKIPPIEGRDLKRPILKALWGQINYPSGSALNSRLV